MFLSRKLEAFMAVVENGSLSKAAKTMNRTTPPVAKSIKDFEAIIGKRLFKREKFGMSLTKDGEVLYNDLKDLYQQEKEITKKHLYGNICNVVNVYYDWGKDKRLITLYKAAEKNNIQVNIFRFSYDNIGEIGDYDGNTLILSSEKIDSERFSFLKEIQGGEIGIWARKDIINATDNIITLLSGTTWLCDPILYKSSFIKELGDEVRKRGDKANIRQLDNFTCCLSFICSGDYVCITDSMVDDFDSNSMLKFIELKDYHCENKCYFYKSKSHSSVLNKFIDLVNNMN